MRIFNKISLAVLAIAFTFVLAGQNAFAATSPLLGSLSTFGIVSSTSTNANTAPYTIVNGSSCGTTLTLPRPLAITGGAEEQPCAAAKGTDQIAAKADLNAQVLASCTSLGVGAVNLNNVALHPTGVYTPGCYSSGGAMNITTGTHITLNGAGTYIFKPNGALTTEADTYVALAGGASACDVFWVPLGATTIGAFTGVPPNPNYSFVGTIFRGDAAGLSITLGHFSTLLGRALAFGSTVTSDANIITVPTCAVPGGGGNRQGTITVVKTVINDNGGTKKVSDFPLFVDGTPVVSGETNYYRAPANAYAVTETSDSNYTRTFSGDCNNVDGLVGISPGDAAVCIVTNDDIGAPVVVPPVPPIIAVVKVPNPLALPGGPGPVTYTYTLTNIGTVPVADVTMVGDTCSPIILESGDTNSDAKLDLNETWIYKCSWNLTETHTNTVVATGWANGISAIDITSATVIVGESKIPPLIHVTKVPSPLTLPVGGGMVTYTKKVTNPGTVALSNVHLTDDKCENVKYVSGDANNDSKLDITETWIYDCQANITKTTTNTVVARGEANGFTVRDFAVATVVVAIAPELRPAAPTLPNTGVIPFESIIVFSVVAVGIFMASIITIVILRKKII